MIGKETAEDRAFMASALTLARRGLGRVWPNPAVGCLLVREGRVVGRGWTQDGGRPHAEQVALQRAGSQARGATAYVTLEPCAHHGKTPPCAEALVAAGVARVVSATDDPDPRVSGGGHRRLREAGIDLTEGLLRLDAEEINLGFLRRLQVGRPLVTLKLAMSLDGRIATHSGHSQWITGPEARARAHLLRAEHDAVMVGSGTAITDNPRLTVRLPGMESRRPIRIVADSRLALHLTHELVRGARETPTWLLARDDVERQRRRAFEQAGVDVLEVPGGDAEPLDIAAALQLLGTRGLTRILVEGGGRLAASLLSAGLVDRLIVFQAGLAIGGDGVPGIAGLGLKDLSAATRFSQRKLERVGPDLMVQYSH